jgi:3',5'-cyclic AMP phosphodiesterase CpdA
MHKLAMALILIFILTGCAITVPKEKPHGNTKLKIALFADSQFVSEYAKPFRNETIWNAQNSEWIANVTLRTVIQNEYAKHSLKELMDKAIKDKEIDMILYLGDGANSGCLNELERLFGVLSEYKKIPIFFVLGNHDYLAAGNTPNIQTRNLLCTSKSIKEINDYGNNLYQESLSKFDVIKMAHDFNSKSAKTLEKKGYTYKDNYTKNLEDTCNKEKVKQHNVPDCFYAAYIYNDDTEIYLLDTSNYDEGELSSVDDHQIAGLAGGICCTTQNHGQWKWLEDSKKKNPLAKRTIFASHYPMKDLAEFRSGLKKRDVRTGNIINNKRRFNDFIRPVLSLTSKTKGYPIWLSAHTHTKKHEEQDPRMLKKVISNYKMKGIRPIQEYNVGSTTDYNQHGLIIELKEIGSTSKVLYLVEDQEACEKLKNKISKAIPAMTGMLPVTSYTSPLSMIGMTLDYREWNEHDFSHSKSNLARLEKERALSSDDKNCLIFSAAQKEYNGSGVVN